MREFGLLVSWSPHNSFRHAFFLRVPFPHAHTHFLYKHIPLPVIWKVVCEPSSTPPGGGKGYWRCLNEATIFSFPEPWIPFLHVFSLYHLYLTLHLSTNLSSLPTPIIFYLPLYLSIYLSTYLSVRKNIPHHVIWKVICEPSSTPHKGGRRRSRGEMRQHAPSFEKKGRLSLSCQHTCSLSLSLFAWALPQIHIIWKGYLRTKFHPPTRGGKRRISQSRWEKLQWTRVANGISACEWGGPDISKEKEEERERERERVALYLVYRLPCFKCWVAPWRVKKPP